MKTLISFFIVALIILSCTPDKSAGKPEGDSQSDQKAVETPKMGANGKGIGQIKEVTLNSPLDQERIVRGIAIYEMKCSACHKTDDQRVVGPGWKDITKRRKPEWIMNMITNVDVMLDKDPEAQKMLELCLMRMPNQNVSVGDARDILEYMRQIDGEK